jgi:hypothetical protein
MSGFSLPPRSFRYAQLQGLELSCFTIQDSLDEFGSDIEADNGKTSESDSSAKGEVNTNLFDFCCFPPSVLIVINAICLARALFQIPAPIQALFDRIRNEFKEGATCSCFQNRYLAQSISCTTSCRELQSECMPSAFCFRHQLEQSLNSFATLPTHASRSFRAHSLC